MTDFDKLTYAESLETEAFDVWTKNNKYAKSLMKQACNLRCQVMDDIHNIIHEYELKPDEDLMNPQVPINKIHE